MTEQPPRPADQPDTPGFEFDWSIPFPMAAREIAGRTFPVLTIGYELIEHLGIEEMTTWLRLAMWQHRGEASSLQRVADEVWFGDVRRAHTWITSLAVKGLISNGETYARQEAELRGLFDRPGLPEPPQRPDRYEPHADGTWSGPWPMVYETNYPPRQQSVVYFLYEPANELVYIGSTGNFRERMKSHHRTKHWVRWSAIPCATRAAAYLVEAELIAENMPVLNRPTRHKPAIEAGGVA